MRFAFIAIRIGCDPHWLRSAGHGTACPQGGAPRRQAPADTVSGQEALATASFHPFLNNR
jgi:hypothetical protein